METHGVLYNGKMYTFQVLLCYCSSISSIGFICITRCSINSINCIAVRNAVIAVIAERNLGDKEGWWQSW